VSKTVTLQEVSLMAMVSGGEDKHPVIIDEGFVKEWVGIGWITLRKATAVDRKKYPKFIDEIAQNKEEVLDELHGL